MSQQKKQTAAKPVKIPPVTEEKAFAIPYPYIWLAVLVFIVYSVCLHFGLTELDDSIFIKDFAGYNEDAHNLIHSFHRGVFSETMDDYYRPFFLDSMILNSWIADPDGFVSYHLINLLLHLGNVLLLFTLFRKLNIAQTTAFILTMIFAVHPVLSQAVAWIPGRNDTMLALFTLAFLITTVDYSNTGKPHWLLLSILFLLCAFFTKETAVFVPPVAFLIILLILKKKPFEKNNIIQYACWAAVGLTWYFVRRQATLTHKYVSAGQIMHDFTSRLPVIVQYLGKIFLPFNLSVFPMLEDTVIYYGIVATILLIVILVVAKQKDRNMIIAGFSIFILFLLPALIVPAALNKQTFEHRLYLPIIGILLVLSQSVLFKNKLKPQLLLGISLVVVALLGFINYQHQQAFNDKLSFWTSAVATSPHSAFALRMLSDCTDDKTEKERLLRTAYAIDPTEKYVGYSLGNFLQGNQDSIIASEKYFLSEKKYWNYPECDYYLARISLEKKDTTNAEKYLSQYLSFAPTRSDVHNNLLLLYLSTRQKTKAQDQLKKAHDAHVPVDPKLEQNIKAMQ